MLRETGVVRHEARLAVINVLPDFSIFVPFGQGLPLSLRQQVAPRDRGRGSIGPQKLVNRSDGGGLESGDRGIGNESIDLLGRKPAVAILVPTREILADEFDKGLLH